MKRGRHPKTLAHRDRVLAAVVTETQKIIAREVKLKGVFDLMNEEDRRRLAPGTVRISAMVSGLAACTVAVFLNELAVMGEVEKLKRRNYGYCWFPLSLLPI